MKAGIRTKFLGIIALATLMPLAIAILAIQTIGYHHLVKERGIAFQAAASHIAGSINLMAQAEVSRVYDFLTRDHLPQLVSEASLGLVSVSEAELPAQVQEMESRWPALEPGDKELAALLTNRLAGELAAFRRQHPLFVEILVTDRSGRLIAATGKTTDYWQADEAWWQAAMRLTPGQAWLEGLHFDDSSATFSLDIAVPVATPEGERLGAFKASLNASPFFSSIPRVLTDRRPARDIVRDDGSVLLRLYEPGYAPGSAHVVPDALPFLRNGAAGWMAEPLFQEIKSMAGFAALHIQAGSEDAAAASGLSRMYVVVHEPASIALRPLRKQVTLLTFAGGTLVLGFGAVGLWMANRKIIAPLRLLRAAAGAVAATVRPAGAAPDAVSAREASDQLSRLVCVETGDELENLARDFRLMGERVLGYQQQLEEEIAAKTAAIQQDLDVAREFQAALMPSVYPAVPEGDGVDGLSLLFHHVYRPASTMGGDFFDVLKLSDHQAGVFIADVMGHGAKSALITAILRTLLQTYSKQVHDPAVLLALVNRQFYELAKQARQTVFVTALYMVADTSNQTLTCASAGHPSPLRAHRGSRVVEPLIPPPKDNPALGLFPAASYTSYSRTLEPGDLVVLFTDGVVEAADSTGEEFGGARLRAALLNALDTHGDSVASAIAASLTQFVSPAPFLDDICLVTLDIRGRNGSRTPASTTVAEA